MDQNFTRGRANYIEIQKTDCEWHHKKHFSSLFQMLTIYAPKTWGVEDANIPVYIYLNYIDSCLLILITNYIYLTNSLETLK